MTVDTHTAATELARAIIAKHSKSFALASRLLPPKVRDRAVLVYAWCRRADDAVDQVAPSEAAAAVVGLSRELDWMFANHVGDAANAGAECDILNGFAQVARDTSMPRHYPAELVAGMAMDADNVVYTDWTELLRYCYRVAGTVGLMMSHVMGVAQSDALRNAVHLGMAMQLTNICRDVREDWDRGRLYLPDALLAQMGAPDLRGDLGRPLPISAKEPLARSLEVVLTVADRFYASGDRGLASLSPRCAWAVRSAREVYSAIGGELRSKGCDVFAPRAVVSSRRKLELVSKAAIKLAPIAAHSATARPILPLPLVEFPGDLLLDLLLDELLDELVDELVDELIDEVLP